MTELTFEDPAETLFSGEIAVEKQASPPCRELLHRMGRVDPMELPGCGRGWVPRLEPVSAAGKCSRPFPEVVSETMSAPATDGGSARRRSPERLSDPASAAEGPDGLNDLRDRGQYSHFNRCRPRDDGTGRSPGASIRAQYPAYRTTMEQEIDSVLASGADPVDLALGACRMCLPPFEEALRLYPPAHPSTAPRSRRMRGLPRKASACRYPQGEYRCWFMPWTLPPARALLAETPRLSCRSASFRKTGNKINPLPVPALRRWPAHLHRRDFALQEAVIALAVLIARASARPDGRDASLPVQKATTQPRGGLPMKVSARVK